jgi:hypothetical protein
VYRKTESMGLDIFDTVGAGISNASLHEIAWDGFLIALVGVEYAFDVYAVRGIPPQLHPPTTQHYNLSGRSEKEETRTCSSQP